MPTCSCGGVSITCPGGCGCFCAGEIDCTRWCEPTVLNAFADRRRVEGGFTRTLRGPDGTERLYVSTKATEPDADLPRHPAGTSLHGCMQGSTLGSMALMLGVLHGKTVSAPPQRADEEVHERVTGTLEEIAARFGLTVADGAAS